MSNTFEIPPGGKAVRYKQVPINAFKQGKGWDAKDPIRCVELIHKPAFILVTNNQEVISPSNPKINDTVFITDKFILQAMTENRTEKVQILETFGDSAAISFFDRKTKIYQMAGTLLEANGGPKPNYYKWASVFKDFYENYLRGTQLARQCKIAILTVMDNLIYFYPLNLTVNVVATAPYSVTFSMNILVTKHTLTANSDRSLESDYKFDTDIAEQLGADKAREEFLEADALWQVKLEEEGASNTDIINLGAIAAGKFAKSNYLEEETTRLVNKFQDAYKKNKTQEIREVLMIDVQKSVDESVRIETNETNRVLEESKNADQS